MRASCKGQSVHAKEKAPSAVVIVKSVLRKKRRKKPGRKPGQPVVAAFATVAAEPARISTKGFEKLEEQIDDCLTAARGLQNEALAGVVGLLRRARNEVVWKLGQ
jgi:hypothetical protein